MTKLWQKLIILLSVLLGTLTASAISGTYSDPGGGTYWCNVYVSSISSGKSYGWCTGDNEDQKMNEFRDFECSNNGKITAENPTFFFKFRYNKEQSKDYDYKSSTQDIYVMLRSGRLVQIVEARSSWTQTDYTWGRVDCSWDGTWFYCRFVPNERGLREVSAIQVESESYFYQSNFWHSDYWFYIHARYLKGIDFSDMPQAKEPTVEWTAPDKVQVSANNSWLPSKLGNSVDNYKFAACYDVSVMTPDGQEFSNGTFKVENRNTGSLNLSVPTDKNFTVQVERHSEISLTFKGNAINQSPDNRTTNTTEVVSTITGLTASYDQVTGEMALQWSGNGISTGNGDYQVCRTGLDESGRNVGKRELIATSTKTSFTDNASYGLELNKNYRYEVFQERKSWNGYTVPSDADKAIGVNAAVAVKSTTPVIPMHLVQDTTDTDNVKMDWTFGNVPKSENDITFKVHRIEPGGNVTRNYLDVTVPRDAGKATFSDENPASACTKYGYFVQLDLADNKVHLYSDTVYAHVTGTSMVTAIDISKGTAGSNVIINWEAHQVGTVPTLYNVQRRFIGSSDWLLIHRVEGTATSYTYTDVTTEPGRYYEYRVVAYTGDCDGGGHVISNTMRDVGFCRASGVVSGRVQFDSGTAVGNVRVVLSRDSDPSTGQSAHSRAVLEPGNAVTLTGLKDIVGNNKAFTLQAYVRPDQVAQTMTIMELPQQLKLDYNADKGMYDVKLNDVVTGSIPAQEYSQLSLISDGTNLRTFVTGNLLTTNNEDAAPQPMYDLTESNVTFYESGNSFDGWRLSNIGGDSGWIISNGAFRTGSGTITAFKDFAVADNLAGETCVGSVTIAAPCGAKDNIVEAIMLDAKGSQLGSTTIWDNKITHSEWRTYTAEFTVLPGTKTIRFFIKARDGVYWSGHYGPMFKDMSLTFPRLKQFDGNWALLPDFVGNIDDIRVWNRALSKDEIAKDADRIIGGETDGLKAYINFDEGLEEYAFDSSLTNGVPNSHHAKVGANTRPSDMIPTDTQLSSYGITNDKGEYVIRGIPFTGSGTHYSVYPIKGIHKFNPTSLSAFIGGTSLTINNTNFTDISSFKVSGTIRYAGTTIPVDSVSFYVDGTPCNKNDKLITSDANGEYEISVPIGSHYIEARRNGHTFVNAGRYPANPNQTYEFLEDTHIDFFDNTLVTLAGRITGGETEGSKPLGYGVSQNTIGKAEIILSALDHPQRMLNAIEKVDGTTVSWNANPDKVEVPSASRDINSIAYRDGGSQDNVKYIHITTDSATGEFSALVPPIRYRVESVKFPNNSGLNNEEVFLNVPAINLTNPLDTVRPDTIYTATKVALPLFKCNKKLLLTYRSNPVMDITQVGAPAGVFGTDTITVRDAGKDIKLPLYTYDNTTGKVTYNYGYPVFQMGRTYNFKIKAYEPYVNYDKETAGKVYKDVLRDSIVTFDNEMGAAAQVSAVDSVADGHTLKRGDLLKLETGQVPLDSIGEGTYKWIAGLPNLSAPYTRNMNASMVINKQTKLWKNEGLTGICFGVVPTGNNFITAGPSHVQMVLRDPPGDASSATWATDSITSDYTYTVHGIHNGTELGVDVHASLEIDVATGAIAFYKFTYNQLIHENAVTWKYDVNKTWDNHTSVTYTNSQSTSTSSTIDYVGRDGDVFIGYSTNYIIGAADKVGLFKKDDGSWGVGKQETMTMDEKFNTHFEYTQNYIETTLFSNIQRTRNTMLKHINSMSEIEEHPEKPTYYTFLTEDDPKYGSSNNDQQVWGTAAKEGFEGPSYYARFPANYSNADSVLWCNEIIKAWKQTLADNEEDKIKAFRDAKYKIGNESFERGVSVTKSTASSTKEVHNSVENFTWSFSYNGKNGYLLDKCGAIFLSSTNIGHHQTKYDVDETTTNERFSYTLNDTQRGNAHTVDVFNSTRGWGPIFRTRGGQTRCPYEGETRTKYYEPVGQLLDYATMKSDNPHISMPVRNFVDIPAGQEAQMQVVFTNESETHESLCSAKLYINAGSNPNGLQVFMDGQPILNGTEIWIEYGSPLTKTLTIKQSDNSVLDYENVRLVLANSCKPERWIYETLDFSAHFVPAAPDITLKVNKNILNQRDITNGDQVVTTISDINRLFIGLKGIRLKYRFSGDSRWITAHEWVTDEKYLTDGHETETQSLLDNDKPDITYNLILPNIDGNYIIAAESICLFGDKEYTQTTAEQTIVRDTHGPQLLGQAYPNTGLLTPSSDIHIMFNEEIRNSYLTKDDNFFITGCLNGAQVDHQVSLQLNGNELINDSYLPLVNTSFAINLWLKRTSGGTLLEHGTDGNNIALNITDDGRASISFGKTVLTSTETIPADRWVFLALNYVYSGGNDNNTLNLLLADEDREVMLIDENNVPAFNGNGQLAIGKDLHGAMHDLTLWSINRPTYTALAQKDELVAPYLPGLVAYWRMDEGHGTVVTDYARSRNFTLETERWNIENKSLAAHFDGAHDMEIDIATISPRNTDSYAIEFWFNGEQDKNRNKTLLSVTDKISIGFDNDNSLLLKTYDNGSKSSLTTDGVATILSPIDYSDGQWHHFALNVRRGISAVAYVDGKAVKTLAEQDVPAPAGDKLYIGTIRKRNTEHDQIIEKTDHFIGDIDELRFWNAAIDGATIIDNRYNEVDTATAAGLIAYFPMQTSRLDEANNIITEFSTANAAPDNIAGSIGTVSADGITQAISTPALKTAPLRQNLDYDFVASNNEIYISLKTLPARMHGNMITFTVKNVRDMADNLSKAITWSARAKYNTLNWYCNQSIIAKDRQEQATFTAMIYNLGSVSENYLISGLPKWITASRTEGTLSVASSEEITFTVLESAPMGSHTLQIYVSNSAGIYCEPIVVQLRVTGNEPLWVVNTDEFESSMNVIGQIYIKDKICTDPFSRIAAFVDGKCCGVASPKLMTSRDAYFVNMTIYGMEDVTTVQPITFRIYDATQGVVLSDVITKLGGEELNLNYRPNNMVGNYDTPVMWTPGDLIEQQARFWTGWNWISLYTQPQKNDLESVFGHAKVFNTIKGKEGFAMNSGTKWTATGLDSVNVGNLYKVKVKDDFDCNIKGQRINTQKTTQTIYTGWNWIGSLSIYNLSLGEAFADLNPTRGDMIKSKNAVAFYDGYKWEGDLTAITPGVGYYYKSVNPTDVTFHYPTIDNAYSYAPAIAMAPRRIYSPFTPVDHHQFSDNMNVVARVEVDQVEVDTLTIAAFIGDECRGVARATDEGYYMLTIAGNAEEAGAEVSFATVIDGKVFTLNEKLPWISDFIYGDLDEPKLLTVTTSGVEDTQVLTNAIEITPTLVRDIINVRSGNILSSVRVYAVNGSTVQNVTHINNSTISLSLGSLPAGVYFVEATAQNGYHVVKRIVRK